MSRSMLLRGCFLAAKKVAVALDTLIRTQYPRDHLTVIGFAYYAREIRPGALAELTWHGYEYGTNLQHGLLLARRILARQAAANKEIVVITDGEPTAHFEDGQVEFSYPPTRRTISETLREVQRCTKEGITINTFMLERSRALAEFVAHMTKLNRGRAFYATPERLGEYVLVDFVGAALASGCRSALSSAAVTVGRPGAACQRVDGRAVPVAACSCTCWARSSRSGRRSRSRSSGRWRDGAAARELRDAALEDAHHRRGVAPDRHPLPITGLADDGRPRINPFDAARCWLGPVRLDGYRSVRARVRPTVGRASAPPLPSDGPSLLSWSLDGPAGRQSQIRTSSSPWRSHPVASARRRPAWASRPSQGGARTVDRGPPHRPSLTGHGPKPWVPAAGRWRRRTMDGERPRPGDHPTDAPRRDLARRPARDHPARRAPRRRPPRRRRRDGVPRRRPSATSPGPRPSATDDGDDGGGPVARSGRRARSSVPAARASRTCTRPAAGARSAGFTVPAINLRAQTFDMARTIFETADERRCRRGHPRDRPQRADLHVPAPDRLRDARLAGAIAAGWRQPVFLQGDHYQFNAKKYAADPEAMTEEIRRACRLAIDAGYRNIDID